MSAQTKLSAKGQVVIPKDVRDRLKLLPGDRLDVIETVNGVFLKRIATAQTLSPRQAVAEFRAIYRHKGPPATQEELDAAIVTALADKWSRKSP